MGRLKHERVRVPRTDDLLHWAMQVMKHHADRKSVLEVGPNMSVVSQGGKSSSLECKSGSDNASTNSCQNMG